MRTWAENIGWGSGSTFQTAASTGLARYGPEDNEHTLLRGILAATTRTMRKAHSFDLSEYIGEQGQEGQAGPRGLPGLPGIGTDYVPSRYVPSTPSYSPARNSPYHPQDVPDVTYTNILIIWSNIATITVFRGDVDCTGWGKFVNNSGSDRQITLWMKYFTLSEEPPAGPGPDNGTFIGDYVTETVPAGGVKTIRVRASFTAPEFGHVYLFAQIDTLESLMNIPANHYGISGKGTHVLPGA